MPKPFEVFSNPASRYLGTFQLRDQPASESETSRFLLDNGDVLEGTPVPELYETSLIAAGCARSVYFEGFKGDVFRYFVLKIHPDFTDVIRYELPRSALPEEATSPSP